MYITLKSPVSVLNTYLSYGCQPGVQQNLKVAKTIALNSCHIPKLSCTSIPALSAWLLLPESPPESCLPQKDPIPTGDKQVEPAKGNATILNFPAEQKCHYLGTDMDQAQI